MIGTLDERHDSAAWLKASASRKRLDFELMPTHVGTTSATLMLYRARVPGGWLVASRQSESVAFIPDPHHEWDGGSVE
jgi:hypothetical protein